MMPSAFDDSPEPCGSCLPYAPYATCPNGLSSLIPGAIKSVCGLPVSLAAEHRAIVGELPRISIACRSQFHQPERRTFLR